MVKASTLRAHGHIAAETKTTLIRFDDSGVEYQGRRDVKAFSVRRCVVAVHLSPVQWAGAAASSARRRPACGKCVRASGLIYRSQSVRTEKRHTVTAPPRLAMLNSDKPLRVHPRPGRTFDGRANIEFALRRSLIVARKHGVDRAKDQGL
jgi:hypothetical protein